MRLLAVADTHFGYETGKSSEARKYTYESMFKRFEEIIAIAKESKVTAILHGGDLFNRSQPRKKVISRAYELIEEIVLAGIDFHIIPGNHERAKLPDSLLSYHKNCHFYNKLSINEMDNYSVIGFPFIREQPQLVVNKIAKLSETITQKPIIVLCHQLFEGATFGPHQFTFRRQHGAIDLNSDLNGISLIITGHVHRAQALADGKIVYPGSIERTSFVEYIEPKGYLIIDIEKQFLKTQFKQIETLPMSVLEFNITNEDLDILALKEQIIPGLHRTLLRFTGRNLSSEELTTLRNVFPNSEYPLLVISPRFAEYNLKPLYDRCVTFEFPTFMRKF